MEKENVTIYKGILFGHQAEGNLVIWFVTTWMKLEGIILRKNKPDKEKYYMVSLISGLLKKKMVVARGCGNGMNGEMMVKRYKFSVIT